ncbi:MAG TPA: hypothetical protein VJ653_00650 [Acidimicrobiales bacterium]|nr:hypothetical protein [Acidimicrobiales bacterium]
MPVITKVEYLSISGVALATPAFWATDLSDLLRPADQRGSDRVIPHGGVFPKPRRRTVSKRSLPMCFDGHHDADGNFVSNYRLGLDTNLAVVTALCDPVVSSTGTRAATLVLASGNRTADIHVEALDIGDRDGPILMAVLQISIPAGQFV